MNIVLKNDADSVKKFASDLCKSLKDEYGITLGHSKMLHAIAKANGHNNWHVMNSSFADITDPLDDYHQSLSTYIFQHGTSADIAQLISRVARISPQYDAAWEKQSRKCLDLIVRLYCHYRDVIKPEKMQNIRELFRLDFLGKVAHSNTIDKKISEDIESYIQSLLGWSPSLWQEFLLGRANNRLFEQHGYRAMQFEEVANSLESSERQVYCVAKHVWSEDNLCILFEDVYVFELIGTLELQMLNADFFETVLADSQKTIFDLPIKDDATKNIVVTLDRYGYPKEKLLISCYRQSIV